MNRDLLVTYLELIAAKAKALAEDVKRGRTWPGDVSNGLGEISEAVRKAHGEAESNRYNPE